MLLLARDYPVSRPWPVHSFHMGCPLLSISSPFFEVWLQALQTLQASGKCGSFPVSLTGLCRSFLFKNYVGQFLSMRNGALESGGSLIFLRILSASLGPGESAQAWLNTAFLMKL